MNLRSATLFVFIGMVINLGLSLLATIPNLLGKDPVFYSEQARFALYMVQVLTGLLPLIVFFLLLYAKQKQDIR